MNEFSQLLSVVEKQLDDKHEENARLTAHLQKLLKAFDELTEYKDKIKTANIEVSKERDDLKEQLEKLTECNSKKVEELEQKVLKLEGTVEQLNG